MGKTKVIKEGKWFKARDLRGKEIMVKTIIERNIRTGKTFSRRIAYRQVI